MSHRMFLIMTLLLITSAVAIGQTRDTTAARTGEHRRERTRAGFRDENGNGIDDRTERPGPGSAARKDRFVDADGDGICDERASGFGFKRGLMGAQQGAGMGKGSGAGNGNGNRYGQGGKK